jgi:hypothetical protein
MPIRSVLKIYTGAKVMESKESETIGKKLLVASFIRWGAYASILFPVAIAFYYVHEFGVNVVLRDQWEMVPKFEQFYSGGLTLADLWSTHNEHRFFVPRLLMLALGDATGWNNVAEMYAVIVCLLVGLVCFLLAFRGNVGSDWRLLFFVPVAFLALSLRQYANMLWGYQLTFALAQSFGVLSLYFLYLAARKSLSVKLTFLAAVASATLASLSAIQGLFVWPAGLVGLLVTSMDRSVKKLAVAIWILCGATVWAVYFFDYEISRASPFEIHPLNNVNYLLRMIGGSLFFPQQSGFAFVAGAMILVLFAASIFFLYREGKLGEYSFWITLVAFSLFALGAIAVGRGGLGLEGSLTSRYTTFSVLAAIGVYVMLVKLALKNRSYPAALALGALLATIAFSIPTTYERGVSLGGATERNNLEAARVLSSYQSRSNEELEKLHRIAPERLRDRASTLERLQLNVFSERPPG